MGGWLSEIRRRNVFKVGIAYLIVAWLVIQIADTVAPNLRLPEWAPRLVTLIVLLGFPIALVLAWVFDLTAGGIKVEPDRSDNKWVYSLAVVLVIAIIAWFVRGAPEPTIVDPDSRSIAVLPFVNMSGDAENLYFSDGISEELLNELAHMPELRVAARTSSFAFRDRQLEIPEIAQQLNVAHILEGSVRRQGDKVRITAQLIDAESGFHLWSESFDRELQDVFAVQNEIAREVAAALQLQLDSSRAHDRAIPQIDPSAYDKYLRARALLRQRGREPLQRAASLFGEVIAAHPDLAEAYGGLALTYAVMPFYTTLPRAAAHDKSRNAAERALALDSGLAEAFGALGDVAVHALRYDDAEALLKRTIELGPSLPAGHYWLAENYLFAGEFGKAWQELEIARELDPLSHAGAPFEQ